ncbi:MAG: type III pantothenate kinase [Acidobacteria bacterium]|nr:type III pantothenate kinase [Acidobacteriota bacterium]
MLLVIDIGNSNTGLGVYEGERLAAHWRLTTQRERTVDEYGILCRNLFSLAGIAPGQIDAIAIASVVPPLNQTLEEMATSYFRVNPLFIEPDLELGMPNRYHPPTDVGADRLVNAVAAYAKYGGPAIVVDFGTATTFDAISGEGEYLGGVIAPGIYIASEALFLKAAKLPRVDFKRPPAVIGQTTVHSIQSGLYYGYLSLLEGILRRMKRELKDPRVIATGGLAELMARDARDIHTVDPFLTLEGLRILYHRLRP